MSAVTGLVLPASTIARFIKCEKATALTRWADYLLAVLA